MLWTGGSWAWYSLFAAKQLMASVMREHLKRLLHHTRLKSIQWVNLNRHRVEFATLRPR